MRRRPIVRAGLLALGLALGLGGLFVARALAGPPAGEGSGAGAVPTWGGATLKRFATLPVQDGGRVKPLDTLAGFKLLKQNGRRSLTTPDGRRLTPIAWLLDCLFFPEQAKRYVSFLVENDEVLTAIGVQSKSKRARYSYAELEPGLPRLEQLARQYAQIPEKERGPAEGQTLQLFRNVLDFEGLIHFLDFARGPYPVDGSPGLQAIFPAGERVTLADVLEHAEEVRALWEQNAAGHGAAPAQGEDAAETAAIQALVDRLMRVGQAAAAVDLFPPPEHDPAAHAGHQHGPEGEREWLSPFDMIQESFSHGELPERHLALLATLERLEASKHDPAAFERALGELHDGLTALADARGEYRAVPLEVFFYRGDFFYRALYAFMGAFLAVALGWLAPRSRWPVAGAWVCAGLGLTLLVTGIALRCVIRGRPPVTTLYETILFITASAVLTALVLEWINRRRIALALAAILGSAGLFLANRYEFTEAVTAGDTMQAMRAVLDTNFWLSTHVTTVTLGYSAGLLASALAHVWLLGKLFGLRADDKGFYREVARMVYGALCFSLIFATVGTILGGIWANYSWGRFWGWDPKENGALMIVLWHLMILHARLGGYVQAYGMSVLAVLGGLVVAFSWWGVNLLNVGLHSYGFTQGAQTALSVTYAVEGAFVLATLGWWLSQQRGATGGEAGGAPSAEG